MLSRQVEDYCMPHSPRKPCGHPGCNKLVAPNKMYCEEHSPQYARSAAARGYDTAWNRARRDYLAAHPLCVMCMAQGKYTKATVVDHIKPHRGDRALFWDRDNWQALCKSCHDSKTGKEDSRPLYHY